MLNIKSGLQITTLIALKPWVSGNVLFNEASAWCKYESSAWNYFKQAVIKKKNKKVFMYRLAAW